MSPILHASSSTSLLIKQTKFSRFFSPLIRNIPSFLKVYSSSFSHFIEAPIQIRRDEIGLESNSSCYILNNQIIMDKSIQIISIPKVIITDSTFVNNSRLIGKNIEDCTGGAIFVLGAVQIILTRCSFQYCMAINAGAVNLCNSKSNITQCSFNECKSFDNVGALWSMGFSKNDSECSLFIVETNFSKNFAGKNCGALNVNMTNTKIFSCIFDKNFANYSVGAAAIIGEFSTFLSFVDFIGNNCKDNCAALWLQGNIEYMSNILKVSLDTVHFLNNNDNVTVDQFDSEAEKNNQKDTKRSAIHTFGIVSLYFKNEICFDGEYESFLINHHEEQIVIQQNFKEVLFKNNSECPIKLRPQTPIVCPEYTYPYVENMLIKGKLPLYMPIEF